MPETTEAAIRDLARRMAQENDVNVRDAEYAIRRMIAHGLIELKENPDA